jgi:hypothetical protein
MGKPQQGEETVNVPTVKDISDSATMSLKRVLVGTAGAMADVVTIIISDLRGENLSCITVRSADLLTALAHEFPDKDIKTKEKT